MNAHYEQLRREGSVRSTAVLWVVGIDEDGFREHLGLWSGSAESLETWGTVFRTTLTFLDHVQPEHRRLLKTTNSMEHDHAEVRRRSRVVRSFPNESPLIRLLGALAIERNEYWLERRYMVFRQQSTTNNEASRRSRDTEAPKIILQKIQHSTKAAQGTRLSRLRSPSNHV